MPPDAATPDGSFTRLDGRDVYRITDVDRLPPFLMSIVSDSDHWMFVSSRGGLTAGRVDEDHALFPYVTDDQLHLCAGLTGPLTLLRVHAPDGVRLWEPLTDRVKAPGRRRHLYKDLLGHSVTLEEEAPDLGLTFRYRWAASEPLGFVRTAVLARDPGAPPVRVEVLDGLVNLLPAGVDWHTQHRFSCLINAYTRCDLDAATGLALVGMTSRLTDKAEPAEALRATAAWSVGLPGATVALRADAAEAFRGGRPVEASPVLTGRRAAYLVSATLNLDAGEARTWHVGADVHLDHPAAERLRARLGDAAAVARLAEESVAQTGARLRALVASADGLQHTGDRAASAHHYANVLFNIMRGGVFADGYAVPGADFAAFVALRNKKAASAHAAWLAGLPETMPHDRLRAEAEARGDADLVRLALEYLPLVFSRRHGDPSRPWNRFAIRARGADGRRVLAYQGNWRDIFQNWEALAWSFPAYLDGLIAKFVNASTMDGFNPYRLSQEGIDWEVPDPEAPWGNLGYWGDHQIVYLLKFLEASERFQPGALAHLLARPIFAYADVPYRLRPYDDLLRDPQRTVEFDAEADREAARRVERLGTDGRLVPDAGGGVRHVCLAEKMLVSVLAKLSNLVPDAGIWMNTQRPEWNDANNALVGHGVSMVTLAYLRRYLALAADLFERAEPRTADISAEVLDWCDAVADALNRHRGLLARPALSDENRKTVLDALGRAFDRYRARVYRHGLSDPRPRDLAAVAGLFRAATAWLDHALGANRRPDGLYHAYNLLVLSDDGRRAGIERLYEMLEGQVAALSSGAVAAEEAAALLQTLRAGPLYRADQDSFLLYPDRPLLGFLEKNLVPASDVAANPLLAALVAEGDAALLARDAAGHFRFHGDFANARDVQAALDALARDDRRRDLVARHGAGVLQVFERVFRHHAFTGRSGTMYGYEGLGCIYWHMVAKLLLAVQECFLRAVREGRPRAVTDALARAYRQVREGLGFRKTPAQWGAVPLDPYSHTPGHAGAQQPGMTGQVKEEILTRLGELGVEVEGGRLAFRPRLLGPEEWLREPAAWPYRDLAGREHTLTLPAGSLAFTFCQTPVTYVHTSAPARVTVTRAAGSEETFPGDALDAALSRAVFGRTGEVRAVRVEVPKCSGA